MRERESKSERKKRLFEVKLDAFLSPSFLQYLPLNIYLFVGEGNPLSSKI